MFCFKSKIFQNWTRAREKITKTQKITKQFFSIRNADFQYIYGNSEYSFGMK